MPRRRTTDYDRKRDLQVTPEPAAARDPGPLGPLTFCVQKHWASRLHYDLRLELDGVLVSWAVPRGPSLDPAEKRLAMHVEDHPLEYLNFEGVIPQGHYGAGPDIVWDSGTYSPDEGEEFAFEDREVAQARIRQELADGKISVRLRGRKLKGSWALVKTSQSENSWLLFKHQDAQANPDLDITANETSVLTGVTLDDLKTGTALPEPFGLTAPNPIDLPGVKPGAPAKDLRPMAAAARETPFSDPAWLFEPKVDGIRALASLDEGRVTLTSRNGVNLTPGYPVLARKLVEQPAQHCVIDGEIAAPDERGVPRFARLQQRMNLQEAAEIERADREVPVIYYAFDLLFLDGLDLRKLPLWQRRELLKRLVDPSPWVQVLDPIEADGRRVYEVLVEQGFEGVVAKRRDSTYQAGRRSPSWVKVKSARSDEFVVGGYTAGNGSRASTFGALLLGQWTDEGLHFAGRVGGGFDDQTLARVFPQLEARKVKKNPFLQQPPRDVATYFIKPDLVAEVRFSEWTPDLQLRAPVFLRMRDDKDADAIRLDPERAAVVTPPAPPPARDPLAEALEQLETPKQAITLEVGGARVDITNLDKEMWPSVGEAPPVTKRDYLRYLVRMSPYLLRQVADRPLTLTRYPNGIAGKSFYQKHWEHGLPDFVEPVTIYSDDAKADQDFLLANNLPTLLWLGQLADLALHVALARVTPGDDAPDLGTNFTGAKETVEASALNYPDFLLFDLDPFLEGEKNVYTAEGFKQAAHVALKLKAILDSAGLRAFVKTSGSSGLHVFVPVVRNLRYDSVRAVCQTIAGALARAHSKEVSLDFDKGKRRGKVYIDVNQNGRIKSLAAAYSTRTHPGAPVSMPIRWDELAHVEGHHFNIWNAAERVRAAGDPWAGILDAKADLRSLIGSSG